MKYLILYIIPLVALFIFFLFLLINRGFNNHEYSVIGKLEAITIEKTGQAIKIRVSSKEYQGYISGDGLLQPDDIAALRIGKIYIVHMKDNLIVSIYEAKEAGK